MLRLTPAVKNLLIINVLVHLLASMLPMLKAYGSLYSPFSDYFLPFQFLTYMFLHANFSHLLGNMFGLFFLGPMLESVWGSKRFYIFYFVCGFGAIALFIGIQSWEIYEMQTLANEFFNSHDPADFADFLRKYSPGMYEQNLEFLEGFDKVPDSKQYLAESLNLVETISSRITDTPVLGASGAVFAIMLGAAMLFPNTEMYMLFFPFPIKLKYLVLFYGIYEIYGLVSNNPNDNVAHFAHLGGMLFAYVLIKYWNNTRHDFF